MTLTLLSCSAALGARFPLLLAAVALFAAAAAPAQQNARREGITLRSRPAGSAPGTPYTEIYQVATPGFGTTSIAQPAGVPFPPFATSGSWQLLPTMDYEIEMESVCGCSADYATNASLGQRFDSQLAAEFSLATAVHWTSFLHQFDTEAGNMLSLSWFAYASSSISVPWQDSASGSANGCLTQAAMSLALVPTSSTASALTIFSSAEVNTYQTVPPPPFQASLAYYAMRSHNEFTVSQSMTLNLSIADSGEVRGESQHFPVLPIVPPNGYTGGSGWWFDPPLALGFDFQQAGGSLFTDILTLPVGIDGDGLFEVEVGGQSLGQFAAGAHVNFVQLLGHGVAEFRIVGIDPAVDSTDAAVFPVQLAFDTPTAEFTMTPVLWRKVGANCSPAVCTQCPALELAPIGSAVEGNLNFGLGIDHGPAGGLAAFFVGLGSASTTSVSLFCGSVVLPLQNAFFDAGVTALTGTSSCDGAGSIPLPLTPVPSLLGVFLTVQAVTLCPAGGLGLTHGIEFAIGN